VAARVELNTALRATRGGELGAASGTLRRETAASLVAARMELSIALKVVCRGELSGGTGGARGGASRTLRREAASSVAAWVELGTALKAASSVAA
jgi:hypothetical protein